MAAQRIFGSGRDAAIVRELDALPVHAERAQQTPDAKQDTARIIADHQDGRRRAVLQDADAIAFGAGKSAVGNQRGSGPAAALQKSLGLC